MNTIMKTALKLWIPAILLAASTIVITSCEDLFDVAEEFGISDAEVIGGLKDALLHGSDTAVSRLSIADGYFRDELVKILLPAEAQPVVSRMANIPFLSGYVDDAILAINRAAEDAATEAKPIFRDAIVDLTIADGWAILQGEDSAATAYLRQSTYDDLFAAFQPKIENSLSKDLVLGMSAERSYERMINTYNDASIGGILWDPIEENSLSEHTTKRALNGLFVKVAKEEKLIREDPAHRATELMKKVFAEQD